MTNFSILKCPICGEKLDFKDKSVTCINRHSFDVSKEGYVNLLTVDKKNSKDPGDNKAMVEARKLTLSNGYYLELSTVLANEVSKNAERAQNKNDFCVLDSGVGTGYYLSEVIKEFSQKQIGGRFFGIDISKHACKEAAKRAKHAHVFTASVYEMPFSDNSFDAIINVFAPVSVKEYVRLLKNNGTLFTVTPAKNHLLELKQIMFGDETYLNSGEVAVLDGLKLIYTKNVEYQCLIDSSEEIKNLIAMTPYFYKTEEKKKEKLYEESSVRVTFSFCLAAYEKQ